MMILISICRERHILIKNRMLDRTQFQGAILRQLAVV